MTDQNQIPADEQPEDEANRLRAHMGNKATEQFGRQMKEAAALLARGKGKEALPLLERLQELRPDDANVLTNLGGAYILASKHDAAIPVLEQAAALEPGNPAVWMNLAAAHLGNPYRATRQRQEQALEAYRRAIEIEPHYPNVHYNMGLIHIDRREWDDAHAAFRQAIEANPHDGDARKMLNRVELVQRAPDDPQKN